MNALTGNPHRTAPGWAGPRGANGRLHEIGLALPIVEAIRPGSGTGRAGADRMGTAALGYVRVSTDEQAASGAGLAAQRAAIEAEVARRGWELLDIVEDAGLLGS